MLAGVGTTWYTWLEQGREIQPSSDVLSALAVVLRLDPTERQHLLSLYDRSAPERRRAGEEQVGEPLQRVVDGLAEQPVLVLGWCWDMLALNRAARNVIGSHHPSDGARLNLLELLFLDPAYRRLFVDWETVARGSLANFRADCGRYIGDPELDDIVSRLTRLSPEFAAWWPQHDVARRLAGRKRLDHPAAGRMHFAFSTLAIADRPGMKLVVFSPVDEEDTLHKLNRLLDQPSLVV
jgi:PAS domain-containing protein